MKDQIKRQHNDFIIPFFSMTSHNQILPITQYFLLFLHNLQYNYNFYLQLHQTSNNCMNRNNKVQQQIDNLSPITTQHHNLFKNKNKSQTPQENKTNTSFQSNFKPNLKKRGIERTSLEEAGVLMMKQGGGNGDTQSNLRSVIKQEENKQAKPFSKKYISSQNNIYPKAQSTPDSKRQKDPSSPTLQQPKNKTRQSFNKKLNNNIIKDEQDIFSKYKVIPDTRQPKIIKKQLINLNKQENIIQHQILQLHKENKEFLSNIAKKYKLNLNNYEKYSAMAREEDSRGNNLLGLLQEKFSDNKKRFKKCQDKIEKNQYFEYLKKMPENIQEEQEIDSQMEDSVVDLPISQPKLGTNIGSYSIAMSQVKDKKFGLNARRTYDYFKQNLKQSKISSITTQQKPRQPQPINQQSKNNDSQNRVTINNKFKDFLLN